MISSAYFQDLSTKLRESLKKDEYFSLYLIGESTQYIRFNQAKIRQTGQVTDCMVSLTFFKESKTQDDKKSLQKTTYTQTLIGHMDQDRDSLTRTLIAARLEAEQLPPDPFAELPQNFGESHAVSPGSLLSFEEAPDKIFKILQGHDAVGIYHAGRMTRGQSNSLGQNHWFETDLFIFDYSLCTPSDRATKGSLSGKSWNQSDYEQTMTREFEKLRALNHPARTMKPGDYRVYLAPDATHELVQMLSWGALSENHMQKSGSPFRHLRSGEKSLSPLFTLDEDFTSENTPRFNEEGELAAVKLPLITQGKLANTLVSRRTAKEFNITPNGAASSEVMRAPHLCPGSLKEDHILEKLGTGLYLSNLHYLNWSDFPQGRVTGMTRYACFWVENGKFVAPIENLRFDDQIFKFFGSELEALSAHSHFHPNTSTYDYRGVGGSFIPGTLLKSLSFTL